MAAGRRGGAMIAIAAVLAGCGSADDPDESGLRPAEKRELVGRYYDCARAGDQACVRATLHPSFEATDHPAGPMSGAAHAETMVMQLRKARVESRILPHESNEVWVVEVWIDRHGSTGSRLRAFDFDDRLIRSKVALGG